MDIRIEAPSRFYIMGDGELFVTIGSIKQTVTSFVECWDLTHPGD